ncbi:MAG TPA: carboxyltransferase domain-containing protein [Gemmatales bacterium]|nr:carboxyltransferase domain-containing protein [Gemmatales bacterium]HMP58034.1 carboxyltransferase domain-containing protein [Gemmatales bacterium]
MSSVPAAAPAWHATWEPLGDQGWLATCSSEAWASALAAAIRAADWGWVADVVVAYDTVAVLVAEPGFLPTEALSALERLIPEPRSALSRFFEVPCWYDPASDLPDVARFLNLSMGDVVRHHSAHGYTVYAIGFVPGFPYLGYLPTELSGVPRLATPRQQVAAGSVGLTGRQTGIYPTPSPGGWRILGRTPCTLVDLAAGFFALQPGDQVRFIPIEQAEYEQRRGERLLPREGR